MAAHTRIREFNTKETYPENNLDDATNVEGDHHLGNYFKGVHSVSTGLVVTAVARPAWVIEIDATAVIPN